MRAVVTGGAGSIGSELCGYLSDKYDDVVALDNNINELTSLDRENEGIDIANIDVRNLEVLKNFLKSSDHVYHVAALKHGPSSENFPITTYETNVKGTENIVQAAKHNDIETLVNISTNKAVESSNVMGATKLIGERIASNAGFCNVRFGNVAMSNGAVIPYFRKLAEEGEDLPVTSPEMTRFFISKAEVVKRIYEVSELSDGGETFVIKMPSLRLDHIAEFFEEKYDVGRKIVGMRPGEKKHEELMTKYESETCSENEEFFIIGSEDKRDDQNTERSSEEAVKDKSECFNFLENLIQD